MTTAQPWPFGIPDPPPEDDPTGADEFGDAPTAAGASPNATDETQTAEPEYRPTWAPIDLTAILDGSYQPPTPELFTRSDGVSLFYRGETHSFHGEPESGKSLIMQIEAARLLSHGEPVLYVDFESDAGAIVSRLLLFGASAQDVANGFTYVHPEAYFRPATTSGHDTLVTRTERLAYRGLLSHPYSLAILDGVTSALVLAGGESKDNDAITKWSWEVPNRIAHATGAAVVMIDHVSKSAERRGRFAIGGQAKLATVTGAAYIVEIRRPLGHGLRGVAEIRCAKDRPGQVREHCGPWRHEDRTQIAAIVTVDSRTTPPVVNVDPPTERPGFYPSTFMEKISRFLEDGHEKVTTTEIEKSVDGKGTRIRDALKFLAQGGYIQVTEGPRNSKCHSLVKPYRQINDPQSDHYAPPLANPGVK